MPVNIACNISNQLGNGGGEMKFEVAQKEDVSGLANCIASEIVNEILENALDIATMRGLPGEYAGIDCDTIAFSVDDGICTFTNNALSQKIGTLDGNIEELNEDCPDIKDIIDGLSAVHISKNNISKAEEPLRLDVEMKRLLSEMMSPPYDIVNYESLVRKDGVGDQPIEDFAVRETDAVDQQDEDLVDVDKTKVVEKKTRVTDLVMNSKQVLSEYLMSDESRKQQEEWEETNEKVIQVIELDYVKPEEINLLTKNDAQSNNEDYVLPIDNELMDNVDLAVPKQDVDINTDKEEAGGESFGEKFIVEKPAMTPGASTSKSNSLDTAMAKEICKRKFENLKKKKWNINLKFWGFGKKKSRDKEEESKYIPADK